ncbi:MAG: hypothetical protein ACMXYK_04460 [Candidatus Woesearchaeota archaeon]
MTFSHYGINTLKICIGIVFYLAYTPLSFAACISFDSYTYCSLEFSFDIEEDPTPSSLESITGLSFTQSSNTILFVFLGIAIALSIAYSVIAKKEVITKKS